MPIADDLVWYLTWRVQQEEGVPTKTKLVKLLYLVDLEHARLVGRSVTGFRWIYYHYGPYAREIDVVLDRQDGQTIRRRERVSYYGDPMYTYWSVGTPPTSLLEDRVRRICDAVCHRWAVAELNELLDYVYFMTPPMRDAVRGQELDLRAGADEGPDRPYRPLVAPEVSPALRAAQEERRLRFDEEFPVTPLDPPPDYDEEYKEGIRRSEEAVVGQDADLAAYQSLVFEVIPDEEG